MIITTKSGEMDTQVKLSGPTVQGVSNPKPRLKQDREHTAQYIAEMALELRNLAKAHGFLSLQGLLEVAYYEAFTAATEIQIPPGEQERLERMSKAAAG